MEHTNYADVCIDANLIYGGRSDLLHVGCKVTDLKFMDETGIIRSITGTVKHICADIPYITEDQKTFKMLEKNTIITHIQIVTDDGIIVVPTGFHYAINTEPPKYGILSIAKVEDGDNTPPEPPVKEPPKLTNLEIVGPYVSFDSDKQLESIIWNDETIQLTQVTSRAMYHYTFRPTTILASNTIKVVGYEETSPTPVSKAEVEKIQAYYDKEKKILVANGAPLVLTANPSGSGFMAEINGENTAFTEDVMVVGAMGDNRESSNITVNGGVFQKYIIGGGYNCNVKDVTIVVNDGTIRNLTGGGLVKSEVDNVNITVNGGTFQYLSGGGRAYHTKDENVGTADSRLDSPNKVNHVTMNINNCKTANLGDSGAACIYGGSANGFAAVETADVTIGEISGPNDIYITAGGSNGYTKNANLTINGNTVAKYVQTGNRGFIDKATLNISAGTLENVYVGGEEDASVTVTYEGTDPTIVANITGGNITSLKTGHNQSTIIPADSPKIQVTVAPTATITNLEEAKTLFGTSLTIQ